MESDPALLAAILMSHYEPYNRGFRSFRDCAYESVIAANEIYKQSILYDRWARAEYDSRFKSNWNPLGEDREIQF